MTVGDSVKKMKKIVFTGGGSGGHVIPNLALIEKLKGKAELYYLGGGGMEKSMLSQYDYVRYFEYNPPKFKRSFALSNLLIPLGFIKAVSHAKEILKKISPDIVFTKGGYVGLPAVFAAKSLGIKPVGHESDCSLGLAHRLALKKYEKLFTAFPLSLKSKVKNVTQAGALLRQSIISGSVKRGLETAGFDGKRKILLVMGGSLGAASLNEKVYQSIPSLCSQYDVVMLTGKGKNKFPNGSGFHTIEYAHNIADLYACAYICITRAGANALCELTACALPFIAVPLAHASRNEQSLNARYFVAQGAGIILPESNLTEKELISAVNYVAENRNNFSASAKRITLYATDTVADYLLSV